MPFLEHPSSQLVKKVSCFDNCVVNGMRKLPKCSSVMVTMVVNYFVSDCSEYNESSLAIHKADGISRP